MFFLPLLLVYLSPAQGLDNGLALTPPMGWLTFERFRCITDCNKYPNECISERLIRRTADLMVSDGYLEAGYKYVTIDDCWLAPTRGPDGRLIADRERFPNGMRAVADYVHSKGLGFGLFENLANTTCAGYPGIKGNERKDIQTLVGFGIDYLKISGCKVDPCSLDQAYPFIGRLLNETGKPIAYSCSWPSYQERVGICAYWIFESCSQPDYAAIAKTCNLFRNYLDIQDSWDSLRGIINWYGDNQGRFAQYAGPGRWNNPDQLIIGNFGLSVDQARVQMSIWAVMASPLIMSTDLATIRPEFKNILLNRDVIAVNQDPLGKQGIRVFKMGCCQDLDVPRACLEIWKRELCDGSYAYAFVSQRDDGAPYAANFTACEMRLPCNTYTVTDLYKEDPEQTFQPPCNFEVRINPTGVKFYKFTPQQNS